jgi:hypothetical protein
MAALACLSRTVTEILEPKQYLLFHAELKHLGFWKLESQLHLTPIKLFRCRIHTVDADGTSVGPGQAGYDESQCCLAGTGGTYDKMHATLSERDIDIPQDMVFEVGKPHVLDYYRHGLPPS